MSTDTSKKTHSSSISCHVLDTAIGVPAAGIPVLLSRLATGGEWEELAQGLTNKDGRVTDLGSKHTINPATYRIRFETHGYHQGNKTRAFFPYVEVAFVIGNLATHYHIPLLLSPFGYSTYRGS